MAARLDLIHLRRHALPAHFLADLGWSTGRAAVPPSVHGVDRRPRLLAAWRVGADGRLACTWSAAPDDPA